MGARLKSLYPHYILSLSIVVLITPISNISEFLIQIRDLFWSAFMLQHMGLDINYYNGFLWYVTHLFYAGTLVYFVLTKFGRKKIFVFLSVLYVAIFYILYLYRFHTIDSIKEINVVLPLSFYRALADILLGALVYKLFIDNGCRMKDDVKKFLVLLLSSLGFLLSFVKPHTSFDMVVILCWGLSVGFANTIEVKNGLPVFEKIVTYCGRKTYSLYCYQLIAFTIVEKFYWCRNVWSVLLMCIITSFTFEQILVYLKNIYIKNRAL